MMKSQTSPVTSEAISSTTSGREISNHQFASMNGQRRQIRIDTADEMLAARIQRSLMSTGRRQLTDLKVTVSEGQVRMGGIVSSYYARQLAHDAAMSVEGVDHFESDIQIE